MKEKNVLLFKFLCNIFVGVRIIKEMPVSVTSGTPCIIVLKIILLNYVDKSHCPEYGPEATSFEKCNETCLEGKTAKALSCCCLESLE